MTQHSHNAHKLAEALSLLKEATATELDSARRAVEDVDVEGLKNEGRKALEDAYATGKAKVEEDPIKSVLLAALVGLLFGLLISRRR